MVPLEEYIPLGSSDEEEVQVVKRIRIKSSAVHLEFSRQVVKLNNG